MFYVLAIFNPYLGVMYLAIFKSYFGVVMECSYHHIDIHVSLSCPTVFHVQRAAQPASQFHVPAREQHWQASPHALHPDALPAARRVATGDAVRQRRPARHRQHTVSHHMTL